MRTKIFKITKENSEKVLTKASLIIKNGGLVVFPTETVYGLGANIFNEKALKNIFIAKGRPADNPIIIHISKKEQIKKLTNGISLVEKKLMDAFWPGPFTLILKKKKDISDIVSGGLSTIAVRMPAYTFAHRLIELSAVPIAAPSANSSGRPSGTSGRNILKELSGKVDMIIDDGLSPIGLESTVVKVNKNNVLILRPGAITKEMIEKVVFPLPVLSAKNKKDLESSPGTKYRHYAPKVKLEIVSKDKMAKRVEILKKQKSKIGIITTLQNKKFFKNFEPNVFILGDEKKLTEISRNLYRALRFFDTKKVDIILCQSFSKKGIGVAIMDRLERASSKIIDNV